MKTELEQIEQQLKNWQGFELFGVIVVVCGLVAILIARYEISKIFDK